MTIEQNEQLTETFERDTAPRKDELDSSKRWLVDEAEEQQMEADHRCIWEHLIKRCQLPNLNGSHVLDFGCNRGGFLKLLHKLNPFEHGLGIDKAHEPVLHATKSNDIPAIRYEQGSEITNLKTLYDYIFSYEVIYLIPDLEKHARQVMAALKPGASYFAATGCYTEYAGWERCKSALLRDSNLVPFDYSLNDYRETFAAKGFEVSACRLGYEGPVRVDLYPEYFPTVLDSLEYFSEAIVLFKFRKPLDPKSLN